MQASAALAGGLVADGQADRHELNAVERVDDGLLLRLGNFVCGAHDRVVAIAGTSCPRYVAASIYKVSPAQPCAAALCFHAHKRCTHDDGGMRQNTRKCKGSTC